MLNNVRLARSSIGRLSGSAQSCSALDTRRSTPRTHTVCGARQCASIWRDAGVRGKRYVCAENVVSSRGDNIVASESHVFRQLTCLLQGS